METAACDPSIADLAKAVGLAPTWTDAAGREQCVEQDDLVALLECLGYPASDTHRRRRSLNQCKAKIDRPPSFLSGVAGTAIRLPPAYVHARHCDLMFERGGTRRLVIQDARLPAIERLGYHKLAIAGEVITLAVAPPRCWLPARPAWGVTVQIPSLRGSGPFGTFTDLAVAANLFGGLGADLLGLSPVHALRPQSAAPFSPYAPSSRIFLNEALTLGGEADVDGTSALIDWDRALRSAHTRLSKRFQTLTIDERAELQQWVASQGRALRDHATFNALSLHYGGRPPTQWLSDHQRPDTSSVTAFRARNRIEIDLHCYGQWLASRALEDVRRDARESGMTIGLIADLAVGVDPFGSDVWANPSSFPDRVRIGAPPDPLGPSGQDWNLTSFSPDGLQETGFAPWIMVVRAALRYAGGLRIDHVFGLSRLWIMPHAGHSANGAYLRYPTDDLLNILKLESHRHHAIMIGEDLGTAPENFRDCLSASGIMGMRVMWFERSPDGDFTSPLAYARETVAMTGTHDTPTVAGWWAAQDLPSTRSSESPASSICAERRDHERTQLWNGIGNGPMPTPNDGQVVVDASTLALAHSNSILKLIPLEDLVGVEGQVNVPGTSTEHPNWRRRMPWPLRQLVHSRAVSSRIEQLCNSVKDSKDIDTESQG